MKGRRNHARRELRADRDDRAVEFRAPGTDSKISARIPPGHESGHVRGGHAQPDEDLLRVGPVHFRPGKPFAPVAVAFEEALADVLDDGPGLPGDAAHRDETPRAPDRRKARGELVDRLAAQDADGELDLLVEGVPKYKCFFGVSRGNRAVQVTKPIEQD
jgi:hypothetical protein